MFKKILTTTALIAVLGVLVFGAVTSAQAKAPDGGNGPTNGQSVPSAQTDGIYGSGRGQGTGSLGTLPPATGDLSAEEAAALTFMREEEKLAHDVYVTLYEQWGLPVFINISQSEQAHSDAVKALLDRYGLADPATGTVGVFTDPELQALYTELVALGSQSVAGALKVGAAIEEIDILDLQERLAQTDNADLQQVFNNLLNGSYSHLRAFVSTLQTQTGEAYQPQYLSLEAYQAIISASAGSGNGAGSNRGGGRSGRP